MRRFSEMLLIAGCACGAAVGSGPDVRVHLHGDRAIPSAMLNQATVIAQALFRRIGVSVEWRSGRARTGCAQCPVEIDLRVVADGEYGTNSSAVAYARPFGAGVPEIVVMYNRIEPTILVQPGFGATLLAHIFAHEIAHVLERTDWHAASGLMKAHWTNRDYWEMRTTPFGFTATDVELIRQGLEAGAK